MISYPSVLIISNKFDFSTDLITFKLNKLKVDYLRLNRDQLGEYEINFNPISAILSIKLDDLEYQVDNNHLISVYYRAPTFLRDIVHENLSEEEQLFRTQWAAFVRALIVFENAKWVNNPVDTYKAEMKPLQLYYADKIGFKTPNTLITNITRKSADKKFAIKSIDTAIINNGDLEAFVYTTILEGTELEDATFTSPFFIQQALTPKIDIRITVVDKNIIAVKIKSEHGIAGDWRKFKGEISYEVFDLPNDIQEKCFQYSKAFNLPFSAIDMVLFENDFYFIEINPTGEWAWLQQNTGIKYDEIIVNSLINA